MHPKKEQWGLSAYWFSLNMEGAALLTILIPVTLVRLSRAGHIGELARLASLAAILAMLVPPIAGAYSDRQRRRGKPRKPMLWWGTTANVAGLIIIPYARSITTLTLLFVLMIAGQSGAQSAYQAMMPEVLPQNQWGKASGYMGLASLLGTVAGLGFAGFSGTNISYRAIAMVLVVGALFTTAWVREPKGTVTLSGPHVMVRNHRDFVRVFWARFLVLLGQTFLMTFILYFFRDVLHVSSPASQTALVAGLALVGAAVSTVLMGRLSDRVSRKFIVFFAGLPMAIAALGFGLDPRLSLVALWALLYGVGYGAFLSVDWALGLESIPDLANVARDLGVWGIASNFPAVIAPAIGGWVLLHAADAKSGYQFLFLLASGTFFLGSVAVLLVGRRHTPKAWSPILAWIVSVAVGRYVKLRYHVGVLGRIPAYQGATLVVGNHGHDIEGMAIPVLLLQSRHFGSRVISAGSQRLMEPGFLPTRMPLPWGRWLSGVNLDGLLWTLGVRPIENEPLFRPICSWGYTVFKSNGNLSLNDVFTKEIIELLAQEKEPPMFLRDLWSPRYVAAAVTPRAVTILKEPYRSFCKDDIRQHVRRQMDEILASVRPGDVLYLTPEGRYTEDGRLGRFRHFWYEAVQRIPNVVLAATSYDLLRPGSLRMWVHFFPWNRHNDVSWVLSSVRPMTASHLVAHILTCHPLVSWDQAFVLAIQLWQQDKDKFIWAKDLEENTDTVIKQALTFIQSSTWPKTQDLGDPRFPYVANLLAYYENQWQETEIAWRRLELARTVSATPEVGI